MTEIQTSHTKLMLLVVLMNPQRIARRDSIQASHLILPCQWLCSMAIVVTNWKTIQATQMTPSYYCKSGDLWVAARKTAVKSLGLSEAGAEILDQCLDGEEVRYGSQ